MAKLPAQALPPDKRPKEPPPPFESTLSSGLFVKWRMPDPLQLVSFDGSIPDPLTAAVIDLLKAEKSYSDDKDPMRHRHESNNIKGMYGLASAMLEHPKLDMQQEYGDGDVLGRREIGYLDVCSLYWLFRVGTRNPAFPPATPNEPERTKNDALDSDGLRTDASATVGDN